MGTIKGRNDMDWTEAKEIKKRWQEYTGELYEKGLRDPDSHELWSLTYNWTSRSVKSNGP